MSPINSPNSPQQTALQALHTSMNAKMLVFAGYSMPLQYPEGIKSEHLHTRARASLFDVSHMGQLRITGGNVAEAFETLVTGDIRGLADLQQRYTLLTNDAGGVIDDLMVTKLPEGLFIVVNAANKLQVINHIKSSLELTCRIDELNDHALLALQGPQAVGVLNKLDSEIGKLEFMHAGHFRLDGIECLVNRCGYTGEDGFEISVTDGDAMELAVSLLGFPNVKLAGLGARDSLRLEAGLCLYGHELDETTSPVEANLRWVIAQKYRNKSAEAVFPGARKILAQLEAGAQRSLVGLQPEGKMPVREGVPILTMDGEVSGRVTSGGFGPSAGVPVAMGYVTSKHARPGTELQVEIRKRFHKIRVAELPFIEHRYYKP